MDYNNHNNYGRYESTANRIAGGVLIVIISAIATLSLFNAIGGVGRMISGFLLGIFGYVSYAYSICGVVIGVAVTLGKRVTLPVDKVLKYCLLFFLGVMIFHVWATKGEIKGFTYGEHLKFMYQNGSPAGLLGSVFTFPIVKLLSTTFLLVVLIVLFSAAALASFYPLLKGGNPYKTKRTKIKPTKGKAPVLTDIAREGIEERVISQPSEVGNKLFVGTIEEGGDAPEFKLATKKEIKKRQGFNVFYPNEDAAGVEEDTAVEPVAEDDTDRRRRAREKLFGKRDKDVKPEEDEDKPVIFGNGLKDEIIPSHRDTPKSSLPFTFNKSIREEEQPPHKPKTLTEAFGVDKSEEGLKKDFQDRMGHILNSEVTPNDIRGAAPKRMTRPLPKPEPVVEPEPEPEKAEEPSDGLPDFVKKILYGESKKTAAKEDVPEAPAPEQEKPNSVPTYQPKEEAVESSIKPIPPMPPRPMVESVLHVESKPTHQPLEPVEVKPEAVEVKPEPIEVKPEPATEAPSSRGSIFDLNIFNSRPKAEEKPAPTPVEKKFDDRPPLGDFRHDAPKSDAVMPSEREIKAVHDNPLDRPAPTPRPDRFSESATKPEQKEPASSYNNDFKIGKKAEPIPIISSVTPAVKKKPEQISIDQALIEQRMNTPYLAPPVDLLFARDDTVQQEDYTERIDVLERTLSQFRVDAKVIGVAQGPTFSRFELKMPDGVPVSNVLKLENDLAMKLKASPLRFEAPIPGHDAFGIEVPNAKRSPVSLKTIVQSTEFNTSKSMLTFALGKDIANDSYVCDLESMPHLLIAGSTGSGKSVCINSLIISLLYKCGPNDLKLILVDPKQVELNLYSGLPHLLVPEVIDEPEVAINALDWCITEMQSRFKMFKSCQVRNVTEYNAYAAKTEGYHKIPRIVLIIDELADFILVKKREIEDRIAKITRLSRAAGIHLVVATQRPSVDIVTGTIKSNLPSRIAFAVTSFGDSMTILGGGGAEKLLGKGDMLFAPQSRPEPLRLQCALVERDEVKSIVDYIKANNETYYDDDIKNAIYAVKTEEEPDDEPAPDPRHGNYKNGDSKIFVDALRLFINEKQASISKLQRKFNVGYGTAANIIEEMEARKYVSENKGGNKTRDVLMTMEQFYQVYGRDEDEIEGFNGDSEN